MKFLLLFILTTLLIACGGDSDSNPCDIDADQDGYVTGSDCSAVNSEKIDCDDTNKRLWSVNSATDLSCKKSCGDTDNDGYFSQCDSYPVVDGIEKIDCDDNNPLAWTLKDGICLHPCSDIDQDGYYFDCETEYPDDKIDCYDKNSTIWRINPDTGSCLYSCVDRDKDGYFFGCDNYPVDENNLPKIDCNDDDQLVHTPVSETDLTCKSSCIDQDGDGYYINCERFDATHPEDDCDGDKANWKADQCRYLGHDTTVLNPNSTCVDNDGDGYYQSCNLFIDELKGPDCNDKVDMFGINNHEKCATCIDEDGDGLYVGCDRYSGDLKKDNDDWFNGYTTNYDLLVVIDHNVSALGDSFNLYRAAHPNHKISFKIIEPGTVAALKNILKDAYTNHHIKAALLIGDLPMAWYEKNINYSNEGYKWEEFPTDTYLGNFSETWYDDDNDGMFDRKSSNSTQLEIITARIQATPEEIIAYFDRVSRYQTEGPLVENKAFVFLDDEFTYMTQYLTNMSSLYSQIRWFTTHAQTSKEVYMEEISNTGGEYFFQVIHASPTQLAVNENGAAKEDAVYSNITLWEIDDADPKGSFFNLFDCSASRFSEENLANTYLKQPYALNTIGASKVTITHDPSIFHRQLAYGDSWGDAFKTWYNSYGSNDEDWFLGTMIMGDPLIVVKEGSRSTFSTVTPIPMSAEMRERFKKDAARQYDRIKNELGTFAEYKASHPEFF